MYFEDLRVWKESIELYNYMYSLFPKKSVEDYFFRDQLLRACLSISNNIAEWYERQTNKELMRFLYIAKWSCGEVRSMLYIAKTNWLVSEEISLDIIEKTKKISVMLWKLIQSLER